MPTANMHEGLFLPIPRDMPSDRLLLCGILAKLAYVHSEPELSRVMGTFLKFDSFVWVETPGNITVNFIVGASRYGLLIVISGTENKVQLMFQLLLSLETYDPSFLPFRVHIGFLSIYTSMLPQLEASIPDSSKGIPVTVIGHSLGGAMAQFVAYHLKYDLFWPVVNLITFGSPAIGGSESAGLFKEIPKTMVRNEGDMIPFLPPNLTAVPKVNVFGPGGMLIQDYQRITPQLCLYDDGHFALTGFPFLEKSWGYLWKVMQEAVGALPAGNEDSTLRALAFKDHFMNAYLSRIVGHLQRSRHPGDWRFLAELWQQIDALQQPGGNVTEFSPGQLDSFLRALSPTPPNISPNPLPPTFDVTESIRSGSAAVLQFHSQQIGTYFDTSILPFSTAAAALPASTGGAVDPLSLAGPQRPWWLFRGSDRNMLVKLAELIDAIQGQSNNAMYRRMAGTPGARQPIIDPSDQAIVDAVNLLASNVAQLLSYQRQQT